jgi:hypothetical protein
LNYQPLVDITGRLSLFILFFLFFLSQGRVILAADSGITASSNLVQSLETIIITVNNKITASSDIDQDPGVVINYPKFWYLTEFGRRKSDLSKRPP